MIATPRYLMLSTFSRTVPSRVYEAWTFLISFHVTVYVHHIAFDRLKSFPCPASRLIYMYIFLKFQYVLCILHFSVANKVIAKCLISESMSVEISLTYKENNKGPRTVTCGTPDKTGTQSNFALVTTTC